MGNLKVNGHPDMPLPEFRIETDRHGNIIMAPPPGFEHGERQFSIGRLLDRLLPAGKVVTECPISTSGGVKAADVAWISKTRLARARAGNLLTIAPEICVEVLSPSDVRSEIDERMSLYFEAGAEEVWICDTRGRLFVHLAGAPELPAASRLCPTCPETIGE